MGNYCNVDVFCNCEDCVEERGFPVCECCGCEDCQCEEEE